MKAVHVVMLTPGQSQRDLKPGMFRICYAWATSSDVLKIATSMSRLSAICQVIGEQGWEVLDETGDITV